MSDQGTNGSDTHTSSSRFAAGDLLIDTGTRSVSRSGEAIDLPRLSYELLLALVRAGPNVLGHDTLIEQVWPGRVVSPETVTQRVRLLRRALGDDAHEPRYIGLVRGQGYRLLPPATPLDIEPRQAGALIGAPPRPALKSGLFHGVAAWVVAALLIGAVAGFFHLLYPTVEPGPPARGYPMLQNALAVLSFDNVTNHPEDLYISEGLGSELRNQLAHVEGLQVAAPASSDFVADEGLDAMAVADRLGVKYVISGELRRGSDQLNVTVRVVDGETGLLVWTGDFAGQTSQLLDIQQRIVRAVVAKLLPDSGQAVVLAPATRSDSANEYLLLAGYFEDELRDQPVINEALQTRVIELYRLATQNDPDSALAHARLAGALLFQGDVVAAAEPLRRALELDSELSEVQYTLGLYRFRRGDDTSGDAYHSALSLNPNHADATAALGMWYWHQTDIQRAGEYLRRAVALDRMALARYSDLGNYYAMTGLREESYALAEEVLERFPDAEGYRVAARIHERVGDIDVGIALANKALSLQPDAEVVSWQIAELYARIGDFESARRYESDLEPSQLFWARRYDELIDVAGDRLIDDPGDIKLYYMLAFALNAEGHHTNAIRLLRRTGLPQSVFARTRQSDATQAVATLYDALQQIGELELARQYAEWQRTHTGMHLETGSRLDWWPNAYRACALEVLGEREQALRYIERIPDSPGLVWMPLLLDLHCFRRLAGEPRYQSVVTAVEERMAELRARVPVTLSRFANGGPADAAAATGTGHRDDTTP